MLELQECTSPQDKRELFAQIDPHANTWVVSDLQSKWHLQEQLIQGRGVLEQSTVVRATELWKKLSFQLIPEMHLLSRELAQTLFWNWIEPLELPWAKSPQAVPVVLNQMQMWMTIFSDPNHEEIMSQWFTDNQEAYVRWGHWFELCSRIWQRCSEENLLMVSWLPAVLLNQDLSQLQWPKSFVFDLGPQMSQVEAQLVKELARFHNVRVIYPKAPWIGLMKNTLRPYEVLLEQTDPGDLNWSPQVSESISFGRFSTQLAEVKDAVARTRAWLEAGVEPQRIAVVAPDIEEYWPSLQLYFAEEGIPVAKPVTAKIGGFLEMAHWISSLRTALQKISSGDLEVSLFAREEQPRLSFPEFRVLFTHVYDAADLKRAGNLFAAEGAVDFSQPLTMADFLAWSLRYWNADDEPERLFQLLQVIGEEVPRGLELEPAQWLTYLEGILARREIKLSPEHEQGVWCVSLSSADWLPVTHGLFLNLNEGSLRTVEPSPVSPGEAQKIFTDTGYAVGGADRQENEFELLWFLQRGWHELRLSFSGTDFQGQVLTPSRLWIWAGFSSDQLKLHPEAPEITRWDEIQKQDFTGLMEERGFTHERREQLEWALKRDTDIAFNSWGEAPAERLSASSLERYWTCPFIFAAERKLKQSDDPVLDLDLDRRGRGSLLHAIVEELCTEPFQAERTDPELEALIDSCREREKIRLGEERLWPAVKAQHVRLAKQFLRFESEWRERFTKTKTVGRELGFECTLEGVKFTGRLDRIDEDSLGRYALIDYKASSNGLTNWKSWLPNHNIQLALYAYLIEKGLTELPAGEVMAANYYVVKDSERRKGFFVRDETAELYSAKDKHSCFIGFEEKQELFAELQQMLKQAVEDVAHGRLNPQPEDTRTCESCAWRSLCRAPHLN